MTDAPRSTTQLEHLIQDPELFDVGVEYTAIRDILLDVVSKVNALSNKTIKCTAPEVNDNKDDDIKQLTQQFIQLQESTKQQYSEFNNELHELKVFFSFQLKDFREKYDRSLSRLSNSISNPESSRVVNEPQIEYITDDDRCDQLSKQIESLTARFDNLMKMIDTNNIGRGNLSSRKPSKLNVPSVEKITPITLDSSDKSQTINTSIPKMDLNLSRKQIDDIGDLTEEVPLTIPEKPESQPVSPVLKPIIDITHKEIKKDPRVDDLVLQVRSIIDEMKNSSEKSKKMVTTINNLIKEFEKQSAEVSYCRTEIENRNDELDRIYDKMAGISVDSQKALQDKFDELLSVEKSTEKSNSKNPEGSTVRIVNDQNSVNQATITALEGLKNSFISNFEKLDSNYRPQISYLKQEINQLKNQVKNLGGTLEEISVPKFASSPIPQVELQIPSPSKNQSENNSSRNSAGNKSSHISGSSSLNTNEKTTESYVQTDESFNDIPIRRFSASTPNGSIPKTIDIFNIGTFIPSNGTNNGPKSTVVTSGDDHKSIPQDELLLGVPSDSTPQSKKDNIHISSIKTVRSNNQTPRSPYQKAEFSFEHLLSLSIVSDDIQQLIANAVRDQINEERLKELSKIESEKPANVGIDVDSIMKQISDLQQKSSDSEPSQQSNSSQKNDNSGLIIATSIVEKFKPVIDNHENRISALQKHIEILEATQDQSKKLIQQLQTQMKHSQTSSIIKNHHPTIVSPRPSSKKFNFHTSKKDNQKKSEENKNEQPQQPNENQEKNKNPSFDYDSLDHPNRPSTSGDQRGRNGSRIVLNVIRDGDDDDGEFSITESDLMEFKTKIHNLERAYKSLSKKMSAMQSANNSRPPTAPSPKRNEDDKVEVISPKKVDKENNEVEKDKINEENKTEEEEKVEEKKLATISIPPVPKKLDMLDKINPNFKSQIEMRRSDQEIDVALQNLSLSKTGSQTSSTPLFDVVERERTLQQQELEEKEAQKEKELKDRRNVRIGLPATKDSSSRILTGSSINFNSSRNNLNVDLTEKIEKIVSEKTKDFRKYSEDQFRILRKHVQNIINDIDLLKAPVQGMIVLPNSDSDFTPGNNNYNNNNSNNNNKKKKSSEEADPDENTIIGLKKRFDMKTSDLEDQIADLRRDIYQFFQKISSMGNTLESSRSKASQNDGDGDNKKGQDDKSKTADKNKNKKENQKKPIDKPMALARSESFLRLKKKFMEEINSPRMLKTTPYENLNAPEPISERKNKLLVEDRKTEDLFNKDKHVNKSFSTSNKFDAEGNKSDNSEKPKRKISSCLSDPSILLKLDKQIVPGSNGGEGNGILTYELHDRYGNELRKFWGRHVPQSIHEFNVTNAEPVKEAIETMVLPYIIEMRSEFQKKVDTALEKSRLTEEMILNKVDKEFVNDFFRKMRMTLVELKNQIDEVKSSVPDKVTHEELQSLATDLYKSVTKDQTTTVGTKSYRCLFCGAPKQNVSGMITDKSVVEALGDPQQARASQNPTMIFGSDKQCYKGRGNYGRTGIASKLEARKIPPLRATTAVPKNE
ncbi:hypothetical protein M9Y10_022085 [Tritrichomonas musculus]|uniref:Uncharacterized protein n=1 Tax=Tritrichomonas musculus TaxID=1915356 RepID=A0ABR2KS57_9EUKA